MIPKIQKILYATDLSPDSVYVLRYALNSAAKHGAEIILLHVIESVDPASRTMLDLYLDEKRSKAIFDEHTTEAQILIRDRLKAIRDKEFQDYPELADIVASIEVCEGFPAEVILRKADELNCDEIVMGTHSKGVFANTFLGSTAKRVLRRSRKPVFIIPIPKRQTEFTPNVA